MVLNIDYMLNDIGLKHLQITKNVFSNIKFSTQFLIVDCNKGIRFENRQKCEPKCVSLMAQLMPKVRQTLANVIEQ